MTSNTKLDEKLEGAENFRSWKYRVMLILEEHELEDYVKEGLTEPEGDEEKARHKKNLIKAKRIITDSIKDHLIPRVSSKKTPKEMFDALTSLFEGKNINRKMTLRNQLKGVKSMKSESMPSYFSRVSQIKEQLEAIGNMIKDAEVVMTTVNGLPRDWEPFVRGICVRKKLIKFGSLWEECVQEEERIVVREEKLNDDEDQALATHAKGAKKRKNNPRPREDSPRRLHKKRRTKKDFSSIECYSCHKTGHIARNCPVTSPLLQGCPHSSRRMLNLQS
jgi:hypothetical protein